MIRLSQTLFPLVVTGAVVSCAEAVGAGWGAAGQLGEGAQGLLLALGLTTAATGLLGLGGWLLIASLSRVRSVRMWARRAAHWLGRDPHGECCAVVERQALIASGLLSFWLLVAAVWWLHRRLWSLQAADLGRQLATGAVAAAAVAAVALTAVTAPLSARLLKAVDRRSELPFPPQAWLRYGLFVALPVGCATIPFARANGDLLGGYAHILTAAALVGIAPVVALAWRDLGLRAPRRWERLTIGLALLALLGAVPAYERWPAAQAIADAGLGSKLGRDLLRELSDVDGDGASPWLGQHDCAPFDGRRGPLARDVPDNGVDEDCDGRDAGAAGLGEPVWYGHWPAERTQPYHVIWIVVDGLRADHVSALGYERLTTPSLDGLAAEGWCFTRAFAQSSATAYSFASMLTGINPSAILWDTRLPGRQLHQKHLTIAERLQRRGWETTLLVDHWVAGSYPGLQQGFDHVRSPKVPEPFQHWSQRISPMVTVQGIEALEQAERRGRPAFVMAHYNDPHYPYVEHEEIGSLGPGGVGRYDGEIAFADRHIGAWLSYLRYHGTLWDRTVVVLTSDHGEALGDHGHEHHARSCYVESTHVPLLLRIPGTEPQRIEVPVALIDIVPTLLELTTGADGDSELQGQSLLLGALAPQRYSRQRPIFCSVASQFNDQPFYRRSVRRGDYALMQDVLSGRLELYNTATDPREAHDLSAAGAQLSSTVEQLSLLLSHTRTGNLAAEQ